MSDDQSTGDWARLLQQALSRRAERPAAVAEAFREYDQANTSAQPEDDVFPRLHNFATEMSGRGATSRDLTPREREDARELLNETLDALRAPARTEMRVDTKVETARAKFFELGTPFSLDDWRQRGSVLNEVGRVLVEALADEGLPATAGLEPYAEGARLADLPNRVARLEREVASREGRACDQKQPARHLDEESLRAARGDLERARRELRESQEWGLERARRLGALLRDAGRLDDAHAAGDAALQLLEEDARYILYPTVALAVATWHFQLRQSRPWLPSDEPRRFGIRMAAKRARKAMIRVGSALKRSGPRRGRRTRDPRVLRGDVIRVTRRMAVARSLWVSADASGFHLPPDGELAAICELEESSVLALRATDKNVPYVRVLVDELVVAYEAGRDAIEDWVMYAARREGHDDRAQWVAAILAAVVRESVQGGEKNPKTS